jgi:hypothetical protein
LNLTVLALRWKVFSFVLFGTFLVLLAGACASNNQTGSPIEIKDPWARASAVGGASGSTEGGTGAAYMVIRNRTKNDDRLLNVQCDLAQFVELHTTETRNGVTMMARVETMEIPAKSKIELKPGGLHIMLIKLKTDLQPGMKVPLVLEFENAGRVNVTADVRPIE